MRAMCMPAGATLHSARYMSVHPYVCVCILCVVYVNGPAYAFVCMKDSLTTD